MKHYHKTISSLIFVLFSFWFSGCAISNEGAVDLRRCNRIDNELIPVKTDCYVYVLSDKAKEELKKQLVPEQVIEKISTIEGTKAVGIKPFDGEIRNQIEALYKDSLEKLIKHATLNTDQTVYYLTGEDIQLLISLENLENAIKYLKYIRSLADEAETHTYTNKDSFINEMYRLMGNRRFDSYKTMILEKAEYPHPTEKIFVIGEKTWNDFESDNIQPDVSEKLKNLTRMSYCSEGDLIAAVNKELQPLALSKELLGHIDSILEKNKKEKAKPQFDVEHALKNGKFPDDVEKLLKEVTPKAYEIKKEFEDEIDRGAGKILMQDCADLEKKITDKANKKKIVYCLKDKIERIDDIPKYFLKRLETIKESKFDTREIFKAKISPIIGQALKEFSDIVIKICDKNYLNTRQTLYSVKKYQKLNRKNDSFEDGNPGDNSKIVPGDALSLHLRSALIADFSELPFSSLVRINRQWADTIGEIVVVANAFEEKDGKELSFENMKAGRVVFYSDNVHKKQFLNFDNMPIYGPMTYQGAPFAFRVSIFELDLASKQAKAMLDTLAQAGGAAYPPASPVLEVLNGVGETFLKGDQTDTEFRYAMILDSKDGTNLVNHFSLEVGNYVLVRMEKRSESVPWDDLVLDENQGRLLKKTASGSLEPYTDNSYLVVEINKNVSDVSVELAQNNYSELIDVLKKQDEEKAENWQSTHAALTKAANGRQQIINFEKAKQILALLEKEDVVSSEKWSKADELLSMIARSGVKTTAEKEVPYPLLSDSQIDYLLTHIRKMVDPEEADWDKFQRSYIERAYSDDSTSVESKKTLINLVISAAPEKV